MKSLKKICEEQQITLLIWYEDKWQTLYFTDERSRDIVVKIMNERKVGIHYEIIKENM